MIDHESPPRLLATGVFAAQAVVRSAGSLIVSVLSLVGWVLYAVIGRILAFLWLPILGMRAEIDRVQLTLNQAATRRKVEAMVRLNRDTTLSAFMMLLDTIDRLDREHAQFQPNFRESLEAAREVHLAQMDAIRTLALDPNFHQDLRRVILEGLLHDADG